MRISWLADAARATGFPVTEVDGWETRGSSTFDPGGLVWHHTAGPATGDMPSLNILINGRDGLPGPLSQYGLGRSGRIYVVASGRANHAGPGGWNGLTGNGSVIGIEAEHTGKSTDPWPGTQLASYRALSALIMVRLGVSTEFLCGHKEWAPARKPDPVSLNMDQERATVTRLINKSQEAVMWTRDLNEAGWRALAKAGIAAGGEAAVVDYWVTNGAQRTLAEHQQASASMLPLLLANVARFTDNPDTTSTGGVSEARVVQLIESALVKGKLTLDVPS